MFGRCSKLTTLNLRNFDTSKVTNMSGMFEYCFKLTSLNLSNWTVHGASTTKMLSGCSSSLAKLKLYNCDEETISNIINSSGFPTGNIIGETRKLYVDENLIDVVPLPEGWEYKTMYPLYVEGEFESDRNLTVAETRVDSSHTDLSYMFSGCTKLESVDTEEWDTSNVTDMSRMFDGCRALVTLDLSNFNTSSVTDMSSMFQSCNALETLDLSNWDTSNVTNMTRIFSTGIRSLTTLRMLNCSFDTVNDIVSSFSATSPACTLYINLSEEEAELLDMPSNWNYEII
jgi:surface protein